MRLDDHLALGYDPPRPIVGSRESVREDFTTMPRSDSSPHALLPTTRIGRKVFLAAEVGDKLVLMNVDKGVYIGLDDVGRGIWDRLEGPRTIASLCDDLQEAYLVSDRLLLERDVTEFMDALRLQGLIEAIP